jgi:type II secretion system protein I
MMEHWTIGKRVQGSSVKADIRSSANPSLPYSDTPPLHSFSRKAGFTLLEVLVALTVFAIGAGGMLVALGNHLRNVSYMEDQARAVRIASREINELRRSEEYEEMETEGAEDRFVWVAEMHSDDLSEWPAIDAIEESSGGTPAQLRVVVRWSDVDEGELTHQVRLEGFEVF